MGLLGSSGCLLVLSYGATGGFRSPQPTYVLPCGAVFGLRTP